MKINKIFPIVAILILAISVFIPTTYSSPAVKISPTEESNVPTKITTQGTVASTLSHTSRLSELFKNKNSLIKDRINEIFSRIRKRIPSNDNMVIYTNYDGNERWATAKSLPILSLVKKENVLIDVNGDGKKDIKLYYRIHPFVKSGSPPRFTYKIIYEIDKISPNLKDNSFEIMIYQKLPKILGGRSIEVGYHSLNKNEIPNKCVISRLIVSPFSSRENLDTTHIDYVSESSRVILLSDTESNASNSSLISVPEAGHIQIGGSLYIEANSTFNVNGQTIDVSGKFYMQTKSDTVDIWWNTTRGYFKINGSSLFEVKDLHFSANDEIVVDIGLLSLDAGGYLIRNESEHQIYATGAFDIKGFNLELNLNRENFTVEGSFGFESNTSISGNLSVEWNETGFLIEGYVSEQGHVYLSINNLYINYNGTTISMTSKKFLIGLNGGSIRFYKGSLDVTVKELTFYLQDFYFNYNNAMEISIGNLSFSGEGYLHLGSYIKFSTKFELKMEQFLLSTESLSASIDYLWAKMDVYVYLGSYTSIYVKGALELKKLQVTTTGLAAGIGYLWIEGKSSLNIDYRGMEIKVDIKIKMDSAFVETTSFYASVDSVVGNADVSVWIGSNGDISATAKVKIDIMGIIVQTEKINVNVGHIFINGKGSINIRKDNVKADASGEITIENAFIGAQTDHSVLYTGLDYLRLSAKKASIDLSGKTIKSASTSQASLTIHGFSLDYGSKNLSVSFDADFESNLDFNFDGSTFSIDAGASSKVSNLNINLVAGNSTISITASLIAMSAGGKCTINLNDEGKVESASVTGSAGLYIQGLTGDVKGGNDFTLSIPSLNFKASGKLQISKEGDGTYHAIASGSLTAVWSTSGDLVSHGNIEVRDVSGNFRVRKASANVESLAAEERRANVSKSGMLFDIDLSIGGYASIKELQIGDSENQIYIGDFYANSGTFKVSFEGSLKSGHVSLDNALNANWGTILATAYGATAQIGYFTGDVSIGYSIKGEGGSINFHSNKGLTLSGYLDLFGLLEINTLSLAPGCTGTASGEADLDPLVPPDYVHVQLNNNPGISGDVEVLSTIRFEFSDVTGNGFSFTFDDAWFWAHPFDISKWFKKSGSLDGGFAVFVNHNGEWIQIYPLNIYASFGLTLYGKTGNSGWSAEGVSADSTPATVDFKAVFNINISGNNSNNNQNIVSSLYSAGDNKITFHFIWGDNSSGTTVDGNLENGKLVATSSHTYLYNGSYTASVTVEVTDENGSTVVFSDSLPVDIGIKKLNVSLKAQGFLGRWGNSAMVLLPKWKKSVNVNFMAEVLNDNGDHHNTVTYLGGLPTDPRYEYVFSFGTHQSTSSKTVFASNSYSSSGVYMESVTVTDKVTGAKGSASALVLVIGAKMDVKLWATPQHADNTEQSVTLTAQVSYKLAQEDYEKAKEYGITDDEINHYLNPTNPTVSVLDGGESFSYRFEFGDGATNSGTSNDRTFSSIPHQYNKNGTYNATVLVEDQDGEKGSASTVVWVGEGVLPVTLTANPSVAIGRTRWIRLTAEIHDDNNNPYYTNNNNNPTVNTLVTDGIGYTYNFDFGDGSYKEVTRGKTASIVHRYSTEGKGSKNFEAKVVATRLQDDAKGSASTTITLIQLFDVALSASPNPAKVNQTVSFTAKVRFEDEDNNNNNDYNNSDNNNNHVSALASAKEFEYVFYFGDGGSYHVEGLVTTSGSSTSTNLEGHASHAYSSKGTYTAKVEVTDVDTGISKTGYTIVTVNEDNNSCTSHYYTDCYNNAVYWYDSCGNRQEKVKDCGSDYWTNNYRCSGNIVQREKIEKGCHNNNENNNIDNSQNNQDNLHTSAVSDTKKTAVSATCYNKETWVDIKKCSDGDGWYMTDNTKWMSQGEYSSYVKNNGGEASILASYSSSCINSIEVREKVYKEFRCENGGCSFTVTQSKWVPTGNINYKPDGSNCSANGNSDGWYDTEDEKWVKSTGCAEVKEKKQVYRDYYCSGGGCTYTTKDSRWVSTGDTRDNDALCGSGYYDSWVYYCSGSSVRKYQTYHYYYCSQGTCHQSTREVNDQLVESCGSTTYGSWSYYCSGDDVMKERTVHERGCSNGGTTALESSEHVSCYSKVVTQNKFVKNCNSNDGWYSSTSTCLSVQHTQEYRDYYCSGGSCSYTVTDYR